MIKIVTKFCLLFVVTCMWACMYTIGSLKIIIFIHVLVLDELSTEIIETPERKQYSLRKRKHESTILQNIESNVPESRKLISEKGKLNLIYY